MPRFHTVCVLTLMMVTRMGHSIEFPGPDPGAAKATVDGDAIILSNKVLSCAWSIAGGRLKPVRYEDLLTGQSVDASGEAFVIRQQDGVAIKASDLRVDGRPKVESLNGKAAARRLAERLPGKQVTARLVSADGDLTVTWQAVLRDGSNYARQTVTLEAGRSGIAIQELTLLDAAAAGASVMGTVAGSPAVAGNIFFAYEHPLSCSEVVHTLPQHNLALRKSVTASGQWDDCRAEYAVDGDRSRDRHWGCEAVPVWLTVDLGSVQDVNTIHLLTWYNNHRVYRYHIDLSVDGQEWRTAVDRSANEDVATQEGFTHRFDITAARYVRVTITGNSEGADYGGHIVELAVYNETPEERREVENSKRRLRCSLTLNSQLKPSEQLVQSCVVGAAPAGQLRRAFLYYVERERAHTYRPFLHYNTWYDLCWPGHFPDEALCIDAIEAFGGELTVQRGVKLDSFAIDDAWDCIDTVWELSSEHFPNGFGPVVAAAGKYNSHLGIWMSPWGGYGTYKDRRIKAGKREGFEIEAFGFALAGPKYYQRFSETALKLVADYGVNYFKFDGMEVSRIDEAEALLRLVRSLRDAEPDIFVNLTTGTWPSPFWLLDGDSTWRGGYDMNVAGKGSKREQWVTYRDMETYRSVVRQGPLYPLNSLMIHGIGHAQYGQPAEYGNSAEEFQHEVRSYFGSGTCLQELYITHSMMTGENWDDLAEAARWSRANSDVLVDTHWIGGDPGAMDVYGWAAWCKRKGILTLRNPDDIAKTITIDIGEAFELPPGAPTHYRLTSPWGSNEKIALEAGKPHMFRLRPFEVLVFDALPQ